MKGKNEKNCAVEHIMPQLLSGMNLFGAVCALHQVEWKKIILFFFSLNKCEKNVCQSEEEKYFAEEKIKT